MIQVSQIPIHVFTVYLFPNAVVGSHKHDLNCQILAWVTPISETVQGPIVITGDLNISWRSFEVLRDLTPRGWADLHELAHHRFGAELTPTCKNATRYTFQFGNSEFSKFLHGMAVVRPIDLDSHAVLVGEFDFPVHNPVSWKWLLPRSFDDLDVNLHQVHAAQVPDQVLSTVRDAVKCRDLSTAFKVWSQGAENSLLTATTIDGRSPGKKFLGRASRPVPVKRVLAAPRFRQGRTKDFQVQYLSVALQVRQVQEQARRLQSLDRLLKKLGVPTFRPCSPNRRAPHLVCNCCFLWLWSFFPPMGCDACHVAVDGPSVSFPGWYS